MPKPNAFARKYAITLSDLEQTKVTTPLAAGIITGAIAKEVISQYGIPPVVGMPVVLYNIYSAGSLASLAVNKALRYRIANCIGRPRFARKLISELKKQGMERNALDPKRLNVLGWLENISYIKGASHREIKQLRNEFIKGNFGSVRSALKEISSFQYFREKNGNLAGLILKRIEEKNGKGLDAIKITNSILNEFFVSKKYGHQINIRNKLYSIRIHNLEGEWHVELIESK